MKRGRAAVHRSTDAFPSAMWHVCPDWKDAVRVWDVVCRAGAVEILREHGREAVASAAARASTPPHDDTDGEIESTPPKPIQRNVDCFELSDDENGRPYFRKTYDARAGAYLEPRLGRRRSLQ